MWIPADFLTKFRTQIWSDPTRFCVTLISFNLCAGFGLKPEAGPSQAQIGQAKLGPNVGLGWLLAKGYQRLNPFRSMTMWERVTNEEERIISL